MEQHKDVQSEKGGTEVDVEDKLLSATAEIEESITAIKKESPKTRNDKFTKDDETSDGETEQNTSNSIVLKARVDKGTKDDDTSDGETELKTAIVPEARDDKRTKDDDTSDGETEPKTAIVPKARVDKGTKDDDTSDGETEPKTAIVPKARVDKGTKDDDTSDGETESKTAIVPKARVDEGTKDDDNSDDETEPKTAIVPKARVDKGTKDDDTSDGETEPKTAIVLKARVDKGTKDDDTSDGETEPKTAKVPKARVDKGTKDDDTSDGETEPKTAIVPKARVEIGTKDDYTSDGETEPKTAIVPKARVDKGTKDDDTSDDETEPKTAIVPKARVDKGTTDNDTSDDETEEAITDNYTTDDTDSEDEICRKVLQKCTPRFVEDMEPDSILDQFQEFFTEFHHFPTLRDIREMQFTSDKNREIVHLVKTKGHQGYEDFKNCLEKTKQKKLVDHLNKIEKQIKQGRKKREKPNRGLSCVCSTFIIAVSVLIALTGICLLIFKVVKNPGNRSQNTTIEDECVSEQYTFPFRQDLPLLGYLRDHDPLIGREWLFKILEDSIFQQDNTNNGIVALADMGFGKSAIISQILCSKHNEKGRALREKTVAFHVCKFDVPSTQKAELFIRRLVSFFAFKSPQFRDIIAALDNGSVLHNLDKCSIDIVACFDQGITFPLKKMKEIADVPWIVIIDALDECFNFEANSNKILDLIGQRTRSLPKWIKILITSRNITGIQNLKTMSYIELQFNDSRNIQDIGLYMDMVYDKLKYNLQTKTVFDKIKQEAVNNEGSNFMYITHVVEHFIQKNRESVNEYDFYKFPSTLGEIYAINFERQFDKTPESFIISKQILEVMGASLLPVTKNEINEIIGIGNNVSSRIMDDNFEKLKYFIYVDNEKTGFKHQSIFEWLSSENSDPFKISLVSGHSLISKYLLSANGTTKVKDPVTLAIHVAKSKDKSLSKLYKSFKQPYQTLKIQKSDIHRVVYETDSVDALKLVLYYINEFDCLNSGGVTAAFVAAAFGHLEQLEYLIENGASITFTLNSTCNHMYRDIWNTSNSQIIASDKTDYFCMYGLLHIAAQNGHSRVCQFIVERNTSLINMTNRNGLRPSDLACENGHLEVLEVLEKFDANINDKTCVYYAAKNDHVDIIRALISKDLKLQCISDEMSLTALQNIENSPFNHLSDEGDLFLNVLDKWWIVFKETALHVAIRMNSLSAKDILLEAFPQLLSCHDALGRTPFLYSIIYNHTELFMELLEQRHKDTCNEIPAHINDVYIKEFYEGFDDLHACPKGARFTHLTAYYDRPHMFIFVHITGFVVDWNIYDGNYLTPLHYAACRSSLNFLKFSLDYKKANIDFDKRTTNGSSVWHTAIQCGHCTNSWFYHNAITNVITMDVKDSQNRSLMIEVADRNLTGETVNINYDYNVHLVSYFIKVCHHSIDGTDIYGRSVIHYALRSGQFGIIQYIRVNHYDKFKKMLSLKDIDNMTPITFATNTMKSKSGQTEVFPTYAYIWHIFYESQALEIEYQNLFTSFEYGLISLLMDVRFTEFFKDYYHHFDKILMYSPYLTTAVLTYHNQIPNDIIRGKLLKSLDSVGPHRLSIMALAYFKGKIIHECNKHISQSPVHKLVYTVEFGSYFYDFAGIEYIFTKNSTRIHDQSLLDTEHFLSMMFGFTINKLKLSCSDQRGLNLYHYALLGGNLYTANILADYGINITNSKISVNDIPYLLLTAKLKSDGKIGEHRYTRFDIGTSTLFLKIDQFKEVDTFISKFLKKHRTTLNLDVLCSNNTRSLSLVHMLAAHGMIESLRAVEELFGKHMLHCINHHKITPLYLAHFFNHKELVEHLGKSHHLLMPETAAEEHFIFNILHDFHLFKNASDPLFCLTHPGEYTSKQTVRSRINLQKCMQEFLISINYRRQDFTKYAMFLTTNDNYKIKYATASITMTNVNKYIELLSDINGLLTSTNRDTNLCSLLTENLSEVLHLGCIKDNYFFMSAIKFRKLCRMMKSLDFSQYSNSTSIASCISKCVLTKRFRSFLWRIVNTLQSIVDILLNELRKFYIYNMYLRLKSSNFRICETMEFANERMAELKFKESLINGYGSPSILSEHVSQSYYNFKYLRILKPTIANKKFKIDYIRESLIYEPYSYHLIGVTEHKFEESSPSILSEYVSPLSYKFKFLGILKPTIANKKFKRDYISSIDEHTIYIPIHKQDTRPFADFKKEQNNN